jgi:hypothetical protein
LPSAVAPGFSGQADDTEEGVVAEPDAMCGAPFSGVPQPLGAALVRACHFAPHRAFTTARI